jgi:hypothetical protein
MTKNYFNWRKVVAIAISFAAITMFSGCGDDYYDPEGTIEVGIRNHSNGHTSIYPAGCYGEGFSMFSDGNFSGSSGTTFASVGKVQGLGKITSIPASGWTTVLHATPGYGYVAKMTNSQGTGYVRIYVTDYMESVYGGIIGIYVKYQSPFMP